MAALVGCNSSHSTAGDPDMAQPGMSAGDLGASPSADFAIPANADLAGVPLLYDTDGPETYTQMR